MKSKQLKSIFSVLIKRELKSQFTLKKTKLKNIDWFGLLLTILTVGGLGVTFVLVLKGMITNYCKVVFINSSLTLAQQLLSRQIEFLTLCYTVIVIAGVFFGIGKINKSLAYNSDMENLLRLPITSKEIFWSKFLTLYFGQTVFMSALILLVNITFAFVTKQQLWFYFATPIICLVLPLFPFLIATALSMPVKYIVDWLKSKYVVLLCLFVAVLGGAFFIYSKTLILIESYFVSGQIKYVFNEETVNIIIAISKWSLPTLWYAKMLFSSDIGLNILFICLAAIACFALVYLISSKLFNRCILMGVTKKTVYNKKTGCKPKSPMSALVYKEFITVLRTPEYTFSYFATAFVQPLMVYCCIGLLTQLIVRMLGMSFNFEVSLLVITMFAVLTNTFCASNVSRDGEMFAISKILPTSYKGVLIAKIIFCSFTNVVSVLATCVVLWATKYIDASGFFIILPIVLLVTTGEIFMATRKDLNRPQFNLNSSRDGAGKTTSFVIIIGLLISIVMGAVAIGLSFFLTVKQSSPYARQIVVATLFAIAIVYCFISALMLFKGLDKKIDNTIG